MNDLSFLSNSNFNTSSVSILFQVGKIPKLRSMSGFLKLFYKRRIFEGDRKICKYVGTYTIILDNDLLFISINSSML